MDQGGRVRSGEAEGMMAVLSQWDAQLQYSSMKLKSLQVTCMEIRCTACTVQETWLGNTHAQDSTLCKCSATTVGLLRRAVAVGICAVGFCEDC